MRQSSKDTRTSSATVSGFSNSIQSVYTKFFRLTRKEPATGCSGIAARLIFGLLILVAASQNAVVAQAPTENYPVDPASIEKEGVPKGEVLKFTFNQSKIFPGTTR